jgi:hypothetical protein
VIYKFRFKDQADTSECYAMQHSTIWGNRSSDDVFLCYYKHFRAEEELTLEQFRLLHDEDLQSLGFKMGARRMLMNYNWSNGSMNMQSASVQLASVETPAIQPTTSQPASPPRAVVVDGSRPTRATMAESSVCNLDRLVLLFFLNLWIIYI